MQNKTKSITIIIGTLVLGFILGGLVNGMLKHSRRGRLIDMRQKAGFIREFERIVSSDDQRQTSQIRNILDEFHQEFRFLSDGHFGKVQMLFDSLHNRLEPILTDEQKKRLNRHHQQMRVCPGSPNGQGCTPPPSKPLFFEQFDINKNGVITKEEFENFHNKQRKEKQ